MISSPSCARQLYLTVLGLCLLCNYINCGSTSQANHNFPDFSLTSAKFPDFSWFLSSCPKCSFASRAFRVYSPNNWNFLPLHIRSSDSLATFQSRLKSHLFASAYHVYSLTHQRLRFDLRLLALYKSFIDI